MPTKPTDSVPDWASDAVYDDPGEAWDGAPILADALMVSLAGQGLIPETPTPARALNSLLRRVAAFARWVEVGTFDADADAHVVETDATGESHLAQLEIVSPAAASYGITVTATATTNGVGLIAIGGSGANGRGATLRGGTGASVGAACVGGDGGGIGVTGDGVLGAAGGAFTGGATGDGLTATGGATSGRGATCLGTSTGAGVFATGGASNGPGIQAQPGGTSGFGVDGRSHATSTANGAAVRGLATADGIGVLGSAADGYGVVATSDTTSPTRSALRVTPQNADPTTLADGDVWHNSTTDELSARIASGNRRLLWRTNGQCYGHAYDPGPATDNTGVTWATACAAAVGVPTAPPRTGLVRIRATCEVGRDTSAAGNIAIRLRDTTSGVTITSRTVELFQATGTYERDVVIETTYSVPAAGARNFELQFQRSGGSDAVAIRNCSVVIDGMF